MYPEVVCVRQMPKRGRKRVCMKILDTGPERVSVAVKILGKTFDSNVSLVIS